MSKLKATLKAAAQHDATRWIGYGTAAGTANNAINAFVIQKHKTKAQDSYYRAKAHYYRSESGEIKPNRRKGGVRQ